MGGWEHVQTFSMFNKCGQCCMRNRHGRGGFTPSTNYTILCLLYTVKAVSIPGGDIPWGGASCSNLLNILCKWIQTVGCKVTSTSMCMRIAQKGPLPTERLKRFVKGCVHPPMYLSMPMRSAHKPRLPSQSNLAALWVVEHTRPQFVSIKRFVKDC